MVYFQSTRNSKEQCSLLQALQQGLAPDGGLYMPDHIPLLPESFLSDRAAVHFHEAAFEVARLFCSDVPENALQDIIEKRLPFSPELQWISDTTAILELFHGPTLAFKDFGASFMAGLLAYARRDSDTTLTILAATSGDTGSAVGQGFYQLPGFRVILLYPSGKVSKLQEQQLTTIGENVQALEIAGTFDDCQKMVKEAFLDTTLQKQVALSSANSINIGRLIPQAFYYVYLYTLLDTPVETVVSVPSGNFGNLTAGLFAHAMGASFKHFIAACNVNDVVPEYLRTGDFSPRPSKKTLSNAMDVGNPSNYERLQSLFNNSRDAMLSRMSGARVSDQETAAMISSCSLEHQYILDPHAAVALHALSEYRKTHDTKAGVILGTAHPAKFMDTVSSNSDIEPELPETLKNCMEKEKQSIPLQADYQDLRQYLLDTRA